MTFQSILDDLEDDSFLTSLFNKCYDALARLLCPSEKAEPHEMETHTRCVLSKVIPHKSCGSLEHELKVGLILGWFWAGWHLAGLKKKLGPL